MKNIYDFVWIVLIKNAIFNSKKKPNWKFDIWFQMSLINSLNYLTLGLILKWFFNIHIIYTDFEPTGVDKLDTIINYSLQVAFPWFLLSYLRFFYKDRYKKYLDKYEAEKRVRAFTYVCISFLLLFGLMIWNRIFS